jgi:hypothetical protein
LRDRVIDAALAGTPARYAAARFGMRVEDVYPKTVAFS